MATTYLSRTQITGSTDADKKFTVSVWLKKSNTGVIEVIWSSGTGSSDGVDIYFDTSDQLCFEANDGSETPEVITSRLFRDPGAWYHVVVAVDTTQGTPADRVKMYINGVQETVFGTATYPTLNYVCSVGTTSDVMNIARGTRAGSSLYFNGVMAHLHYTEGQVYAASDFGSTDATSGIWVPNTGPSVTYGNNGLFLKFASGALGTDSSGEGNTMAVSGTMTPTKDNAQNNFATGNPLALQASSSFVYSNGNNKVNSTTGSWRSAYASLGYDLGKWYWEAKCALVGDHVAMGVCATTQVTSSGSAFCQSEPGDNGWGYKWGGEKCWGGDSPNERSYGDTYTTGDIIGCAHDNTNGVIWWSKNGVWQASATIAEIAAGTTTNAAYSGMTTGLTILPATQYYGTTSWEYNFGNGYFGTTAVASTNADDAGIGSFEYDVPAGYYAICTNNIATYG